MALAWKEAFAAKDTTGFYGKLAAAIIGTAAVGINTGVAVSQINKYRSGTTSAMGGYSVVGEAGPEIVEMPAGARVLNAMETRNISNDSRSIVYNFHDAGSVDTIRASVRSGGADRLISELFGRAQRMGFAT